MALLNNSLICERSWKLEVQALRLKLQAGESSPIVENFDGQKFITELHKKYVK